jgi:hypothetical protein
MAQPKYREQKDRGEECGSRLVVEGGRYSP